MLADRVEDRAEEIPVSQLGRDILEDVLRAAKNGRQSVAAQVRAASAIEGASSTKPVATARKDPAPSRATADCARRRGRARVGRRAVGGEEQGRGCRVEAVRAGAVQGGAEAEADGGWVAAERGEDRAVGTSRPGQRLGDAAGHEPAVGH
jgi:hypothetical protein